MNEYVIGVDLTKQGTDKTALTVSYPYISVEKMENMIVEGKLLMEDLKPKGYDDYDLIVLGCYASLRGCSVNCIVKNKQ